MRLTGATSSGNGGRPVVDGAGRVVGIATAKIVDAGADGLHFAIPVQILCAGLARCAQA